MLANEVRDDLEEPYDKEQADGCIQEDVGEVPGTIQARTLSETMKRSHPG